MCQIALFATESEIGDVLDRLEPRLELQFTEMGRLLDPNIAVFTAWRSRPAARYQHLPREGIDGRRFLVLPRCEQSTIRTVHENSGITSYRVDQLLNPRSVELQPSHRFDAMTLLGGRLATASEHPDSVVLYKRLKKEFSRAWKCVEGVLVAPEAMAIARNGGRLTWGVDRDPKYDLTARPASFTHS
jgi:hypothetical protein